MSDDKSAKWRLAKSKYFVDKYGISRCVRCNGTNLSILGCGDCWNAANLYPSRGDGW